MRDGAVEAVDNQAAQFVDLIRRLSALERVGHIHGYGAGAMAGRNLLNNGQKMVNQRGLANVIGVAAGGSRLSDRWIVFNGGVGVQNLVYTTMTGFGVGWPFADARPANIEYIQMTTADAALAAGDLSLWQQNIEGRNLQHLNWGTPFAQPVVFSMKCWSTVAATYIIELSQVTAVRSISKAVTVTPGWNTITAVFPGDTGGSGIPDVTTAELQCSFWTAAGSSFTSGGSLQTAWGAVTTNKRAFGISNTYPATVGNVVAPTNLQLEVGIAPTPYEVRSYPQELADCQRYFRHYNYNGIYAGAGVMWSPTDFIVTVPIVPAPMRAAPVGTMAPAATWNVLTTANRIAATIAVGGTSADQFYIGGTTPAATAGQGCLLIGLNANAVVDLSAEI